MNEQEIFEYLKTNLSIEVGTETEFGPVEMVVVKLYLTDPDGSNVLISKSHTSLPDSNH